MDLLFVDVGVEPLRTWRVSLALVLAPIVFDLGVLHRQCHRICMRESLWPSVLCITVGIGLPAWVWQHLVRQVALDALTGFVVQKSLAMDHFFVIAVIFAYLGEPRAVQPGCWSMASSE